MGLTNLSTGSNAFDSGFCVKKRNSKDKIIAIAGNPNVGKSTLFNSLTGMKQHTGNWPGKTVTNAQGYCKGKDTNYVLVDIPGTYSLFAHSPEEEIARDFICFGKADTVVVVCDATCLERSLNLVLQTLEITKNVVVCVNLLDEAKRKGIKINLEKLSDLLGVKVVGTVARKKKSLLKLINALDELQNNNKNTYLTKYSDTLEKAIDIVEPKIKTHLPNNLNSRWLSLRLIEGNTELTAKSSEFLGLDILSIKGITQAVQDANELLLNENISKKELTEEIASAFVESSEELYNATVTVINNKYSRNDRKIDNILTNRFWAYPFMLLLFGFVFWLTISGANYISEFLSYIFAKVETLLNNALISINTPLILQRFIIEGVYRVPAWVVSVMLPPMAIFFPLFTLLEDVGYLPRIAYNLDKPFKRCKSCGKQALTMCMGFGCNAAGVVGCRIIDSPRERIVAIITNSLVPCNGRFPAIIAIISMFFIYGSFAGASILSALYLTLAVLLAVLVTFFSTKLLSSTLLKGEASSYTLELPPYRKPQICQVLVRSVFDRTLFVLGRSLTVAIPAGIIIWLMANINLGEITILTRCSELLNPIARLIGLDGAILIAFILGFPANEIVLPIVIMVYMSAGSLSDITSLTEMHGILVSNGWTPITAICTVVFSLFHWPCSTTLLTVKKETGSIKWTVVSALFPTAIGIVLCLLINFACKIFV